jgi:Tol biopolymer transport system component
MLKIAATGLMAVALVSMQTAPPDTDIFLAPLIRDAQQTLNVGTPVNITSSPGYDNQPSFTPDGSAILFTSGRTASAPAAEGTPAAGGGRPTTDVYRYDLATRQTSRVTNTPESEYSPTVTPGGLHISVIRVEADNTQRLWRFALDGTRPELVLSDVKPVGYHVWANKQIVVLFVLGQPPTLQVADVRSGKAQIAAKGIGRSLQKIPRGGVSFVLREPRPEGQPDGPLRIMELNLSEGTTKVLIKAVEGAQEADHAWTPDGRLLMVHAGVLYGWTRGAADWVRVADLAAMGLRNISRLAVGPKGDSLAVVAAGAPQP